MLGTAGDKFFLGQMAERVVAHTGNAMSRSMMVPDRERAGTPHVMAKATEMPGPQRQVSSSWMPGMSGTPTPAAPPTLMSHNSSALPGMSGITIDTSTMLMLAAGAFGAWYLLLRKKAA